MDGASYHVLYLIELAHHTLFITEEVSCRKATTHAKHERASHVPRCTIMTPTPKLQHYSLYIYIYITVNYITYILSEIFILICINSQLAIEVLTENFR